MIAVRLVNIHHNAEWQSFFLVMGIFKIYSLNNFQIYEAVLLCAVAMLCTTSQDWFVW